MSNSDHIIFEIGMQNSAQFQSFLKFSTNMFKPFKLHVNSFLYPQISSILDQTWIPHMYRMLSKIINQSRSKKLTFQVQRSSKNQILYKNWSFLPSFFFPFFFFLVLLVFSLFFQKFLVNGKEGSKFAL